MAIADVVEAEGPQAHRGAIVRALEHDIVFGRMQPDERLVEDDLIARFGATRHNVRRAIDDLAALGLVVRRPNRGASVVAFTVGEVENIYEIRALLQGHAISRMELPLDASTLAEMERLHEAHQRASEAGDAAEVFALNNDFHAAFFARCGNAFLAEEIGSYAWRTHPIRSQGFLSAVYLRSAQAEHAAIIAAARSGDRATLLTVDRLHIMRPKDAYLAAKTVAQRDG